jgi:hypothetical protein
MKQHQQLEYNPDIAGIAAAVCVMCHATKYDLFD